jgi:hypothetical protein
MSYDKSKTENNFIELWEKLAETIQNNLSTEEDD